VTRPSEHQSICFTNSGWSFPETWNSPTRPKGRCSEDFHPKAALAIAPSRFWVTNCGSWVSSVAETCATSSEHDRNCALLGAVACSNTDVLTAARRDPAPTQASSARTDFKRPAFWPYGAKGRGRQRARGERRRFP
jgi:hypothetical protein